MSDDFFDQLESEFSALTRQGAHLAGAQRARFRRALRHGVTAGLVVVALAVSLVSEFPATASGHAHLTRSTLVTRSDRVAS